ncbi:MAG: DUF4864 domain-containing protein [Marinobacter sp.]|uniref:DUF4864 domain-containing protein n=1 Tax=Marinobacter sp. TaxID=50741 RepID=UPI00299E0EE6|nr:DUF4864 domain-containing protein [Marinobacter sp.]MDX1635061.1 DUF4864 domain-containing protein [Marinobacter sp.]
MRSIGIPTIALLLGLIATSVRADVDTPNSERQAIIGVILAQVEAFASDDAERAWGLASDAVQQRFGSPEVFVGMVRSEYPAIYGAESLEFLEPIPHPGFLIQPVFLRGPDGHYWDAYYRMSWQDGTWRIAGVTLKRAEAGI